MRTKLARARCASVDRIDYLKTSALAYAAADGKNAHKNPKVRNVLS
ncbi:hypothetical protein [Dendronalium sp. ChiSLP03b]|nr:hypothetical protein [Dendronalium sp. ChiSLP03b]MDZ8208618.1 hypothetical protein [Dendronalium sp. ChiSLP03b]